MCGEGKDWLAGSSAYISGSVVPNSAGIVALVEKVVFPVVLHRVGVLPYPVSSVGVVVATLSALTRMKAESRDSSGVRTRKAQETSSEC